MIWGNSKLEFYIDIKKSIRCLRYYNIDKYVVLCNLNGNSYLTTSKNGF